MKTTPRVLICGSMAFDHIMVFEGRFKDQILPDQVHILNVSFLVPSLRKDWGGCAGNIAYGLHALGGKAVPMATLGHDGQGYIQRMASLGIDTGCLRLLPDHHTAQCFITTDLDDNQITAFHPGAMAHAHLNTVQQAQNITLGIVSPDGRDAMIEHAQQLAQANIPFVFDPGQGLPMFNKTDLLNFIDLAPFAAVNDYEGRMLCDRTGLSLEELAQRLEILVVTRGGEGSWVWHRGQRHSVPCVKAEQLVDPTGCGDAYRAGLLFGLAHALQQNPANALNAKHVLQSAQLASLMGALKIAHQGGQNYHVAPKQLATQFAQTFGEAFFVAC